MLAFHGKASVKKMFLTRVRAHRKADEIQHGFYWQDGKGCAIGCTIHDSIHANYETELGIPQILARLEDRIFEGVSNGWAKEWPERFLEAIPVGADLTGVWREFVIWLLVDETDGVIKYAKTDKTIKAIRAIAAAYERNETKREVWLQLRSAAATAAYDAATAAYDGAYAAYAAAYAAYAAAAYAAAAYAAYAASADAAAYAAYAAYAIAADAAARQVAFKRQGEKLLELMAAAPVPKKKSANRDGLQPK